MAAKWVDADMVAAALVRIYKKEFAGKGAGRFQISWKRLRILTGRRNLQDGFKEQIRIALAERGLACIQIDSGFAIIRFKRLDRYRRATLDVVEEVRRVLKFDEYENRDDESFEFLGDDDGDEDE